jgi:hypothetical protein
MDYANNVVVVSQLNESIVCSSEETPHWGCGPPGYYFGVGAAYCSILPWVKRYRASVSAGRLSEEIVSTSNMWIWDYPVGSTVTKGAIIVACLPEETRNQLLELDFILKDNGLLSTPNLTTTVPETLWPFHSGGGSTGDYWIPTSEDPSQNISIPAECAYIVDIRFTDPRIQEFLDTYLYGNVGIATGSAYFYDYADPPQLLAIYNNGNPRFEDLNETFANISDTLTQHIRRNGMQNFSGPAYGLILPEQTCIRVHWAWLSYPATLVALTLIFLVAMVTETRRGEMKSYDWKSEPLALIFRRLDDGAIPSTEAGQLFKRRDMQDTAERILVRLGQNEDEWAFVGRSLNAVKGNNDAGKEVRYRFPSRRGGA